MPDITTIYVSPYPERDQRLSLAGLDVLPPASIYNPPLLKSVVVINMDDTLAMFTYALVAFINERTEEKVSLATFGADDIDKLDGLVMDAFYSSTYFCDDVQPVEGAMIALTYLRQSFDLHAVTTRPTHTEVPTRAWLQRHYPDIFAGVHFVSTQTKLSTCRLLGALLLVDNGPETVNICAANGLPCVLFGDNKHIRSATATELDTRAHMITKAESWSTAIKAILSMTTVLHRIYPDVPDFPSLDPSTDIDPEFAALSVDVLHRLRVNVLAPVELDDEELEGLFSNLLDAFAAVESRAITTMQRSIVFDAPGGGQITEVALLDTGAINGSFMSKDFYDSHGTLFAPLDRGTTVARAVRLADGVTRCQIRFIRP
jgi:5'(3')-deoxyribonucleotidase